MKAKIEEGASRQYMEKMSSAMGALERALERFTEDKHGAQRSTTFPRDWKCSTRLRLEEL